MKYCFVISCAIFLLAIVVLCASSAYAYDDGDFQVWNTEVQDLKINHNTKITLEEEFRWGDNASEFYYQHYDLGFFHSLNKNVNLGLGYRYVYELKQGTFKPENQPYVCTTLFWNLSGFSFEDRNRLEYRQFTYQSDAWRYHNKVTVKTPWKFTRIEIQPYLSDEIYVSFGDISQFDQNRLSAGLSTKFTKCLRAEIYYMLQSQKGRDQWTDANILGTKLKIDF